MAANQEFSLISLTFPNLQPESSNVQGLKFVFPTFPGLPACVETLYQFFLLTLANIFF